VVRSIRYTRSIVIAAAALTAAAIFILSTDSAVDAHDGDDRESRTLQKSKTDRPTQKTDIKKSIIRDPKNHHGLVEFSSELRGDLANDEDILRAYVGEIPRLTGDQLAGIINNWEGSTGKSKFMAYVAVHLAQSPEIEKFVSVIEQIPKTQNRSLMIKQVARDSAFFGVEGINETISKLPKEDLNDVALGVKDRLAQLDQEEAFNEAQKYYDKEGPVEVLRGVSASITKHLVKDEPEEALKWSLEGPPDAVAGGDGPLLDGLVSKEELSNQFVDTLIERGELDRASLAAERIAQGRYMGNPVQGLKWAASLPATLSSRRRIILQQLGSGRSADSRSMEQAVQSLGNKEILELWRTLDN
jgi:hypothetical protein